MKKVVPHAAIMPDQFAALVETFFHGDYRISQRASWSISKCVERKPDLALPFLNRFIRELQRDDRHVSVRRNILRFLQFMDIPRRHQGKIASLCFDYLLDQKSPVAIRVFSMTVLANLAGPSPELGRELELIIQDNMDIASAAFRSRGRRILKQLEKQRK